jgi:hypothetical protein
MVLSAAPVPQGPLNACRNARVLLLFFLFFIPCPVAYPHHGLSLRAVRLQMITCFRTFCSLACNCLPRCSVLHKIEGAHTDKSVHCQTMHKSKFRNDCYYCIALRAPVWLLDQG